MGEYSRLGYWDFWGQYREAVVEVDKNLCMPVLQNLQAKVGVKWPWDANCYSFTVGGVSFYVIFDAPQPNSPVEVEIKKMNDEYEYDTIGKISVRLPRKRWDALRKQLRELIVQPQNLN